MMMPYRRTPQPGVRLSNVEPSGQSGLALVTKALDPVLVPLGFAPGQVGVEGQLGQVTFCRGERDSPDGGCVDLVVVVEAMPEWHITDVRYWGFPRKRWHLDFDRATTLVDQLTGLARTLPSELGHEES